MTSFPSALVPDIPVKPSSRCSHSSRVSGIRNELPYTVLPGPVSGKKRMSLPWPYLADTVVPCTTMYLRQAVKRGCFASKWPAVPLSDVKALIQGCGSWQTVWQLPHPFPVPFWSTSLLWLGYRAAETPCFHAPLGRSLRCPALLFPYCLQRVFWTHSALKGTENSLVGPGLYCSNQPIYLFSSSCLILLTFFFCFF